MLLGAAEPVRPTFLTILLEPDKPLSLERFPNGKRSPPEIQLFGGTPLISAFATGKY